MKAINIEWDVDDEDIEDTENLDLPDEVELPDHLFDDDGNYDSDEVSDYLSDLTGFCHYSFLIVDDRGNEI